MTEGQLIIWSCCHLVFWILRSWSSVYTWLFQLDDDSKALHKKCLDIIISIHLKLVVDQVPQVSTMVVSQDGTVLWQRVGDVGVKPNDSTSDVEIRPCQEGGGGGRIHSGQRLEPENTGPEEDNHLNQNHYF